jgi:hypothetical protein
LQNQNTGYLDEKEQYQQMRIYTLIPAFFLSNINSIANKHQFTLIRQWILQNINLKDISLWKRIKFNLTLYSLCYRTLNCDQMYIQEVCTKIKRLIPVCERYKILKLCLRLAGTKKTICAQELQLIRDYARWLDLDKNKFQTMQEKALSITIYKIYDTPGLLGIDPEMSNQQALIQLNQEYAKWNSRITHSNKNIYKQANKMLQLIAETRNKYIND